MKGYREEYGSTDVLTSTCRYIYDLSLTNLPLYLTYRLSYQILSYAHTTATTTTTTITINTTSSTSTPAITTADKMSKEWLTLQIVAGVLVELVFCCKFCT